MKPDRHGAAYLVVPVRRRHLQRELNRHAAAGWRLVDMRFRSVGWRWLMFERMDVGP
jgi:hypothetical protein